MSLSCAARAVSRCGANGTTLFCRITVGETIKLVDLYVRAASLVKKRDNSTKLRKEFFASSNREEEEEEECRSLFV